jgi:hypothetical protein
MALVNCEECGKTVSTKATTCPHCGAPVVLPAVALPSVESPQREVPHSPAPFVLMIIAVLILVLLCALGKQASMRTVAQRAEREQAPLALRKAAEARKEEAAQTPKPVQATQPQQLAISEEAAEKEQAERERRANEANSRVAALVKEAETALFNGDSATARERLKAAASEPYATDFSPVERFRARLDLFGISLAVKPALPAVHKMGTTVTTGYTSYVVHKARAFGARGDDGTAALFMIITVTIRNEDKKARTIPPFTLVDEDGAEYNDFVGHNPGDFQPLESLNPGMSRTGDVMFRVPPEHRYKLKLSGGFWSPESALVEIVAKPL